MAARTPTKRTKKTAKRNKVAVPNEAYKQKLLTRHEKLTAKQKLLDALSSATEHKKRRAAERKAQREADALAKIDRKLFQHLTVQLHRPEVVDAMAWLVHDIITENRSTPPELSEPPPAPTLPMHHICLFPFPRIAAEWCGCPRHRRERAANAKGPN